MSVVRWAVKVSVVVAYAAYVGTAWYWYGHATSPTGDETDRLLDDLMPEYEVAERHQVRVMAPPEVTLSAAAEGIARRDDVTGMARAEHRARQVSNRGR